jgi:hypothetical protein
MRSRGWLMMYLNGGCENIFRRDYQLHWQAFTPQASYSWNYGVRTGKLALCAHWSCREWSGPSTIIKPQLWIVVATDRMTY